MLIKHNQPSDNKDENQERRFSDEKTDQKIHKHLSDINDQISEQDIENVRTDITTEDRTETADTGDAESGRVIANSTVPENKNKTTKPNKSNGLQNL